MASEKRRSFLKKTGIGAATGLAAPYITSGMAHSSPNDRVNVAVMGIRSRGMNHVKHFSASKNVQVTSICDIDTRLLKKAMGEMAQAGLKRPKTETDLRKVLDDKDVDVLSVAAPNHWHVLAGIWACQAGKDIYVEKPVSWSIWEGRKLVEAVDKYNRIGQTGSQRRSEPLMKEALKYLKSGELGDIYMAKAVVYRRRGSIGHGTEDPIPPEVDYDKFRGPAPMIPFSENRFHYHWHWFWDTGNGETGNNGPHPADLFKWFTNRTDHPYKIQSMGGIYVHDTEQQTPNTQLSVMQYADGLEFQLEVRNLYTNLDGNTREGLILYGSKGYMEFNLGRKWMTFFGRDRTPGPSMDADEANGKYQISFDYGEGWEPHFQNFIDCVRSRKKEDLAANIEEGHYAATLCHLSNLAYRTGRTLYFDSRKEEFIADKEANKLLKRPVYREPYVVPENV